MTKLGIRIGTFLLIGAALAVTVVGLADDSGGSPGAGGRRNAPEVSLSQAASSPSGVAAGDLPAAAVGTSGASAPDVAPGDVLGSSHDQVVSNGCRAEYGDGGQCLPAAPPSHEGHDPNSAGARAWSCDLVRESFPTGLAVKVSGVDPLGLDTNRNGTACDPADGG